MLFVVVIVALVASVNMGVFAILIMADMLASKKWKNIFKGDHRDGI